MASLKKILYIGIGEMGFHISGKISGVYPVKVWDLVPSKASESSAKYGTEALLTPSPFSSSISDIDCFMTCLPTSSEVSDHVDDFLRSNKPTKPGALWIDNTSGNPSTSQELSRKLQAKGVGFLDAAVSGGRRGAIAGNLTVMVGGPKEHFDRTLDVLQVFGNPVKHINENVGAGHAVKSLNNLLYGCNLALAAKVAQTFSSIGIDPTVGLNSIKTSSGGSTAGKRLLEYLENNKNINITFSSKLIAKDIGIALGLAHETDDDLVKTFSNVQRLFSQLGQDDVFNIFDHLKS